MAVAERLGAQIPHLTDPRIGTSNLRSSKKTLKRGHQHRGIDLTTNVEANTSC